ncbi:PREDICTED: uncharacterized protein LOC106099370 [Papilio polytes]|uniref:uncharacterized protein LOC106099370 n=1 Tax=Papilio polytes TaxID=76194 RepID=UPI000675E8BF|nr:PREDICTED: uncharacterized protein LOC106099370 [Papilio polytes]XP_013133356.1 PREDICTED: uncharacterized protein LOC106099370 [Papilio polytes]
MTEVVEGGAELAWRLLATLEGGSLLLVTSAMLAYTALTKVAARRRIPIKNVLITNNTNTLGQEVTKRLTARGCAVTTVMSAATSEAMSGKADALVVIGAEMKQTGLDGLTQTVTEDVYYNVKLLESLSPLVRTGGYVVWACAGAASGAFCDATSAYDAVLKASLQYVARSRHCEPIWTERCEDFEVTAERIVASLLPCASTQSITTFSIRNAVQKLSEYAGRWLKIIS